jgi:hypothetical protein
MVSLKEQVTLANHWLDGATSKGSNLIRADELKAIELLVEHAQVAIAKSGHDIDVSTDEIIKE